MFAARDPSGKEPLFYSFAEDGGASFANQALAARGLDESWQALLPGARGQWAHVVALRGTMNDLGFPFCDMLVQMCVVGCCALQTRMMCL